MKKKISGIIDWLKINKILLSTLIIVMTVSIGFAAEKQGYFIDEVYTFGLANNPYGPFLEAGESSAPLWQYMYDKVYGESVPEMISNVKSVLDDIKGNGIRGSEIFSAYKKDIYAEYSPKWFTEADFLRYAAVQEGHRFDALSVYYNQFRDVHPPLYYLLINAISSFNTDTVPRNAGLMLNLLCLLGTCVILYHLSKRYFADDKVAACIVLFFGLSMGTISMVIFIRMYALLTFCVMAGLMIHLIIMEKGFQFNRKEQILLVITTIAGFLTQYFYLIYLFFIVITMTGIMISEKKYKEIFRYYCIIGCAGIISVVIWPVSIRHIFLSSKGTEAAANLLHNNIFSNMKDFTNIIARGFCINNIGILLAVILGICSLVLLLYRKCFTIQRESIKRWSLVLVPLTGYLLTVCKVAEIQSDRYIMCTYPMIAFVLASAIFLICSTLFHSKQAAATICVLIGIVTLGFLFQEPNYLYRKSPADIAFDEMAQGKKCLYIYSGWNTYTVFVPEFIENNNNVIFLNEENLEVIEELGLKDREEFLIYISDTVQQDSVMEYITEQFGADNMALVRKQESKGVDPDETFSTNIYKVY